MGLSKHTIPASTFEGEENGWHVELRFQELDQPVKITGIIDDLKSKLLSVRSPLTMKGTGVQGYLFALLLLAGQFLMASVDHLAGENLKAIVHPLKLKC
jgi:hypothetical protein